MNEVWKDIYFWENVEYDYRGLYQVSNFGRVKSLWHNKEKILKAGKNTRGYNHVVLCKNGKKKQFTIHRLVAHMFLNGYFENAQVNHKDENKTNNYVENLEWCTREYNMNFGTRNERASESNKSSLVVRYDLDMNLIDMKYQFEYVRMGFNQGHIYSCCKGKRKSHKGFIFKYHEEVE